MHIDFHHGLTYVVARLAGFNHKEAETVAYCAQYVDESSREYFLHLYNGTFHQYMDTSYPVRDKLSRRYLSVFLDALSFGIHQVKKFAEYSIWIPFHFLPGNNGKSIGETTQDNFFDKLVCTPDSFVAQEMIADCLQDREAPYGLHRLGVALHVYADTWSHQGFMGMHHRNNAVAHLSVDTSDDACQNTRLKRICRNLGGRFAHLFLRYPMGHSAAFSYPDHPCLRWSYRDAKGEMVYRDNPKTYLEAADAMYRVMLRFRNGDTGIDQTTTLPADARGAIVDCLSSFTSSFKEKRHSQWLKAIWGDLFGFGSVKLAYKPYDPSLQSELLQRFREAQRIHQKNLLYEILPRFDISLPIRIIM